MNKLFLLVFFPIMFLFPHPLQIIPLNTPILKNLKRIYSQIQAEKTVIVSCDEIILVMLYKMGNNLKVLHILETTTT